MTCRRCRRRRRGGGAGCPSVDCCRERLPEGLELAGDGGLGLRLLLLLLLLLLGLLLKAPKERRLLLLLLLLGRWGPKEASAASKERRLLLLLLGRWGPKEASAASKERRLLLLGRRGPKQGRGSRSRRGPKQRRSSSGGSRRRRSEERCRRLSGSAAKERRLLLLPWREQRRRCRLGEATEAEGRRLLLLVGERACVCGKKGREGEREGIDEHGAIVLPLIAVGFSFFLLPRACCERAQDPINRKLSRPSRSSPGGWRRKRPSRGTWDSCPLSLRSSFSLRFSSTSLSEGGNFLSHFTRRAAAVVDLPNFDPRGS